MSAARVPFTHEDQVNLASVLVNHPKDSRERPSVHKEVALRFPNHPYQGWMDHYKKSGKAAVDLQISKIQRKRKAEKEAKKARQEAAALTNDDDDEQQEEEQQKKPAQPVASTSKKRAREPTPAHDSMDDDDSDAPPPVSRKERIPFDDDAYAVLVRTMAKVEERKWTKKAVFEDLADKHPEHTVASWGSFYRDNRAEVEKSVAKYVKQRAQKDRDGDTVVTKPKPSKALSEAMASTALAKSRKASRDVVVQSSSSEDDAPSPPPKIKKKVGPASVLAKRADRASSSVTNGDKKASSSTVKSKDKGKAKVIEILSSSDEDVPLPVFKKPRTSSATPLASSVTNKKPRPSASAVAAPSTKTPVNGTVDTPFNESDESILIQALARAELKDVSRENTWKYLGNEYPRHSADAWRDHYFNSRLRFMPLVTARVGEIMKARKQKKEAIKAQEEAKEPEVEAIKAQEEAKEREVVPSSEPEEEEAAVEVSKPEEEEAEDADMEDAVEEEEEHVEVMKVDGEEEEEDQLDDDSYPVETAAPPPTAAAAVPASSAPAPALAPAPAPAPTSAAAPVAAPAQADPSPPTPNATPPHANSESQSQERLNALKSVSPLPPIFEGPSQPQSQPEAANVEEEQDHEQQDRGEEPVREKQDVREDEEDRESMPSPFLKAHEFPKARAEQAEQAEQAPQQVEPALPAADVPPASTAALPPAPSPAPVAAPPPAPEAAPIAVDPHDYTLKEGEQELTDPDDLRTEATLLTLFDKRQVDLPSKEDVAPSDVEGEGFDEVNGWPKLDEGQQKLFTDHYDGVEGIRSSLVREDDERLAEAVRIQAIAAAKEAAAQEEEKRRVEEEEARLRADEARKKEEQAARKEEQARATASLADIKERGRRAAEEAEQKRVAAEDVKRREASEAAQEKERLTAKEKKRLASEKQRLANEEKERLAAKEAERIKGLAIEHDRFEKESQEKQRLAEEKKRQGVAAEQEKEKERLAAAERKKQELADQKAADELRRIAEEEAVVAEQRRQEKEDEAEAEAEADRQRQADAKAKAKAERKKSVSVEVPAPPSTVKKAPRASAAAIAKASSPAISIASPAVPGPSRTKRPRDSTTSRDDPSEAAPLPAKKKARISLATTASASSPGVFLPDARPAAKDVIPLRDALKQRSETFSIRRKQVATLYFACGAPYDLALLDTVCTWYAPGHRPAKNSAEYAALAEVIRTQVWTYHEDAIVLGGTTEAKKTIDERKGQVGACRKRQTWLKGASTVTVEDLKQAWPWEKEQ